MKPVKAPPPPKVPLDLWRQLYDRANRFQAQAPWEWMEDIHVLGVDNAHGLRLLCVLGMIDELYGLVSYREATGINELLRLAIGVGGDTNVKADFRQNSILTSFNTEPELLPEDRKLLKQIGYQPLRTRPVRYPIFQSSKPGFYPWFLDEQEVRVSIENFERASQFAAILQSQPDLFDDHEPGEYPFVPKDLEGPLTVDKLEWRMMEEIPVAPEPPIQPAEFDLNPLMKLPAQPVAWEMAVFFTDMPVAEGARPQFPKIAIAVTPKGIIGHFLEVGTTMVQCGASGLVEWIREQGFRPSKILLDDAPLRDSLLPFATALGVTLCLADNLPLAGPAREALSRAPF